MTSLQCQFCGAWYTPYKFYRSPSQTCDRCWLEINAALTQEGSKTMLPRGKGLRDDYWGCYHDYDVEMAELAALKRHERRECEPPCDYCEAEAADKETEEK